jgi:outer membrane lipoprotein-sorting protein
MMKTIKILLLLGLFSVTVLGQSDPKEIMKKSRDQAKIAGLETKTILEINDGKGNKRIRETTMASRIFPDGTEKRVIVFLAPPDVKGTSMLIYDYDKKIDDMWIYMPALRKSRKIVSTDKAKSFMGSEFSNSDLSIGTIDDYTYTIEGTETVDQQECWKIRLTPITPAIAAENGISYKLMWIGKKDYMPRKTQYIGPDGKTEKELMFSGIKLLDPKANKYYVTHMEMKNLKNNRFSTMNMAEVSINPKVNEEYFTLSFIEKQ